MKQVEATVISNQIIVPGLERHQARNVLGSQLIWLHCPEIAREARPGQFVMAGCGEECVLPRPFSIHQVNDNGIALFFNIWEDGKGTDWLSQREKDGAVPLFGPLGNGFSINPTSKNLLLVAGGIGIAPLCFLARQALKQGHPVTFLYGAANKDQYPEHLLPPTIKLVRATEDGTVGRKGMVTDFLPEFIDLADQVFACGPLPMYLDMLLKRQELRGKPVQISLEVRMGCGRGVCYGCTLKTKNGLKKVCEDGPVFDLSELDNTSWGELTL
ncbi:dihydroorotate dehydrogenase electron transfer subunit [Chloroflexota bacterium]